MIFMKHRNLEKAVVLSLILSTGVYGSAWAETERPGSLWQKGDYTTEKGNDLEITSNTVGIGPDGTINVNDGAGDLTVDTSSNSAANGIQSGDETQNKTQVTILADDVTINAGANGIFTELTGASSSVTLGEDGENGRKIGNLTITSGGQGIDNKKGNVYIYGADNSIIDIHSTGTSGYPYYQQSAISNTTSQGIVTVNGGTIILTSDKYNGIYNTGGITTLNSKSVTINADEHGILNSGGTTSLNTQGSNNISGQDNGINSSASGTINIIASENYNPDIGNGSLNGQTGYDNNIYGFKNGIESTGGTTNVIADNNNYVTGSQNYGYAVMVQYANKSIIKIIAGNDNILGKQEVYDDGFRYNYGGSIRLSDTENADVDITSVNGATRIYGDGGGIYVHSGENNNVTVDAGTDINIKTHGSGVMNSSGKNNIVELIADRNNTIIVDGEDYSPDGAGLETSGEGASTRLDAVNNTVALFNKKGEFLDGGVTAHSKGSITMDADSSNLILANTKELDLEDENIEAILNDFYGDQYAINAQGAGTVDVNAGLANTIYGAVYATGTAKVGENIKVSDVTLTGQTNFVRSAAVIEDAGDLQGKEVNGGEITGMDVVSALYAEEGASIKLSGVNNIQTYYDDPSDTHTSERAVWAYKGADITIEGNTVIRTSSYESSPNDMDIAIAAGTSTNINDHIDMANVNLKYENYNGAKSFIQGDILAAYGGEVNIAPNTANTRAVSDAGINITGNLLAGNDGKLDVDLGNGGILVGRADDYGDAALNNGHGSGDKENGFYNPAFSSEIVRNGTVNLTMGEGSQWYVNGQSWITSVDTSKAQNTLIDLVSANTNLNMDSHALTIGTLKGDTNFRMKLDGNRQYSDMLYIGNGNGTYNIELDEVVTIDDMYADSGEGFKFSGLRFATVGKGSDVDFNVTATDKGFNNIIYTVGKDVYGSNISNHENDAYNNGDGTSLDKPGNAAVEDLLKDAEQAGAATINTNDIMLLANEPDTGENLDNNENHLNYKLIDMQTVRSDAGETMLNMSRANYSNAIYMDRLNKRLGEARYINDDPEEDEGMWVRVRHDRIGKDEAFRSQNTMYELGYDKRQECDNGKRRVGFAVDYMHGDTGYNDIAGKGEIDRYGLWLYDTWTGNKGHYVDYVAKWGHLQNDFEVYNSEGKVTGDYSNNVFSISAEYGRKKDMGNDWYFEPQAQLQLARVTGADYTTSQGTKVSVDGINSLIGRAGFRIGKDFGEEKQSTLYFKADVLHEFLGDQTIRALDGTTNGWQSVDYENQGTWYDIGIGYAAMLSQSTYAFIDLEQSFGNDNDDTYQINAGVRWTF